MSERRTLRFGPFELIPDRAELRKHGLPLRLQEQPLRILTVLLERPGELVTREELIKLLWADDTFVDFDKGLNSAVTRLRQVLADSADNPRYIETVVRHGYRFIGQLQSTPVEEAATPAQQPSIPPQPRRLPRWVPWVGLAAVATIAAVLYATKARAYFHEPYTTTPLTALAGNKRDPSFSPDGREVVFAWDRGDSGPFKLFVKRIGSDSVVPVTKGPGDDRSPAWSPDGSSIAFLRHMPEQILLMIVAPFGGPERTVAEMPPWVMADEIKTVSCVCWSSDGRWLLYPDSTRSIHSVGLTALAVRTGEKRSLTSGSADSFGDFSPVLSPDLRTLSFVRMTDIGDGDLYLMPLAAGLNPAGQPVRVNLIKKGLSNAVWTGDGRHLLFPMQLPTGSWRVHQITPTSPGQATQLASLGEDIRYVAISAAARRLALNRERLDDNVWSVELPDGPTRPGMRTVVGARPIIASPTFDDIVSYSPDGAEIAFNSDRSGTEEIWVSNRDGSKPRQVTSHRSRATGWGRWSPDGSWLAFHSRVEKNMDIYLLQVRTGAMRRLTTDNLDACCPAWSRDGHWVYFSSRQTGHDEVWKIPRQGGRSIQLTHGGGLGPVESTGGEYLYYDKPASSELWRMPVAGGAEERVVKLSTCCSWTVGPSGVWFIRRDPGNGTQELMLIRSSTRAIEHVAFMSNRPLGGGMAVSPDEHTILYVQLDRVESDLMLVEEFP